MTENKPSSEKRIKIDPFYPRLVAAGLLAAAGAYFFVPYRELDHARQLEQVLMDSSFEQPEN